MFHRDGPTLTELLVQGLSSLERGYDALAPKFDVTPFRTPDVVLARVAERLGPVERALDLCCGTGAALLHLHTRCRTRLVGVDLSAGMLAQARKNLAGLPGPPEPELLQADVLQLGEVGRFDVVTCFGAFGHFLPAQEERLVEVVARLLAPGGRFAFVTIEPPAPLSPAALLAHGFNAAWRVRNLLWRPRFVMYYLTFLLPRARRLLEAQGLRVTVERGAFPAPYQRLLLVTATRA